MNIINNYAQDTLRCVGILSMIVRVFSFETISDSFS